MDEWILNIIGAASVPIVAIVAKYLLERFLQTRTKEVTTTTDDGRSETIAVNANATNVEIANTVRAAMSFEHDIAAALNKIVEKNSALKTHHARTVDFIVQANNKKFAVEVKLNLDRMMPENIEKYLAAEDGLSHLLLVSRIGASERVLRSLQPYVNEGRVSFITVPLNSDPTVSLTNALERVRTASVA